MLKDYEVYVGRGGRGVPASKWGNPFRIGPQVSRSEAISRFRSHFKSQGLFKEIGELVGKDLLCHCNPDEACHGDYLMAVANHCFPQLAIPMAGFVDDRLPVRFPAVVEAPLEAAAPSSDLLVCAGWRGTGPSRRDSTPGWRRHASRTLQVAEDTYEDVMRRKASREQCPLPAPASKKA